MSIDRLWAGWRMPYVSEAAGTTPGQPGGAGTEARAEHAAEGPDEGPDDCVFCRILASGEPDDKTYVVRRGRECFALLNAYPYTSGHLMVLPYRHVGSLGAVSGAESSEMWSLMAAAVDALASAYRPDGMNIGCNLGRAAGAGLPGHLHFHVLPRWSGDTNFMTTVANARVLPETLADSWSRLTGAWPG